MTAPWPADHVERRLVAALKPFPRNARTHSDAQVAQVAASIQEWGWTFPVLVDSAGEIIAGHARVLAAQRLGLTEVPCIVVTAWTEAQKRAYVIADNKLALNAGWDEGLLTLELSDLKDAGFELGLTGFDAIEVDELLARANLRHGLTDENAVPELPAVPFTQPGDVWILGHHRLVCGDCTIGGDVTKALDGAKPMLMVTDPPYGVNYDPEWRARAGVNLNAGKLGHVDNDDRADWREAWALFPGDVAYVWHAGRHSGVVEASLIASGFEIRAQIIWVKDRFALSRGDYHWQHEPCWYAVRKGRRGHWQGNRSQSTRWDIAARDDSGHGHGTQKPVEAMLRPMLNNSVAGQAVYEPFCGSGTSLVAAEMSGRRCLAIELNPAYVDVAVQRWEDFSGEKARREADGAPFERADRKKVADEARDETAATAAQAAPRKPARSRAAR
jgi:DNA modification methylase